MPEQGGVTPEQQPAKEREELIVPPQEGTQKQEAPPEGTPEAPATPVIPERPAHPVEPVLARPPQSTPKPAKMTPGGPIVDAERAREAEKEIRLTQSGKPDAASTLEDVLNSLNF